MQRQDYVICVNVEGRWYVPEGDEDDVPQVPGQTTDPVMAGRYAQFSEARQTVRALARRYPNMQFKVGELSPLADAHRETQYALDTALVRN